MEALEKIEELIKYCNEDNSNYWKKQILKTFPECKRLLYLTYSPMVNFYVSSNNLYNLLYDGGIDLIELPKDYDIFKLLKDLSEKKITGSLAKLRCLSFLEKYSKYEETILKILDKDLSCGISIKTINKAYPGLIEEFNIPLANSYKEFLCNFEDEEWFVSRKLDGVRCLAFILENDVKFFTRGGKEVFTLDIIKRDLMKNFTEFSNCILDGEVCILDENNNEDFKSIMKLIRRKNFTIKNPKFCVFDIYGIKEFIKRSESLDTFDERLESLRYSVRNCKTIKVIGQARIESEEHFKEIISKIPKSWEGIMIRKNKTAKFKRSNELLKFKKFIDTEYKVLSTIIGTKMIDGVEQDCCGCIVINHKGFSQKVGSGLTDEQRLKWYRKPEEIIGKTVTVRYFEESIDENGIISLRLPSLKYVYQV